MTLLERKVDAIARCLLTNDTGEHNACAMAELESLLEQPATSPQSIDAIIRNLLVELGVPEHIKGSKYLVKAIGAVVENDDLINAVTGKLYLLVAEAVQTTPSRAERAIRHAVEVAWDRGDLDVLHQYFGNTVSPSKGKPTNSEFIARCASVVRDKINNTN